jgi:hypothetical protein
MAIVQQQFHLLRASLLHVHSSRRLHAPACGQQQQSEQALLAKHLYKFYPSGDMFGIRSRICCSGLPYSQSGMPHMFLGST